MSSLNTKCLFQKLCKLDEKRVRYQSHLDNYRFYRLSRILPKGLKIKCSPSFGDLDPAFSKKWNDTLTKTSFHLLELLEAQCLKCIDKQSLDIESTESQLKVACLNDHEWDNFQAILSSNINHVRSSLQRQQDKKRWNAQTNHKKYLYRRFYNITTKPSGDNIPNPPTHTVINLSDTALSDPQVKLLSRGLKFCPTPKEHNQLSL